MGSCLLSVKEYWEYILKVGRKALAYICREDTKQNFCAKFNSQGATANVVKGVNMFLKKYCGTRKYQISFKVRYHQMRKNR